MGRTTIIFPAYNAANTLKATYLNLPKVYDELLLCDDASQDKTKVISQKLGIKTIVHERNLGYGANQKSLFNAIKASKSDVIIMVHPDDQYNTKCLPEMIEQIHSGSDLVLGSRFKTARLNGMPLWKYAANRFLTFCQNQVYGAGLSEYHTGLRAYNAKLLKKIPYETFSDNFVFDSELIAWTIANKYQITEVDTDCYYNSTISSIKFWPSFVYGLTTLRVLWRFGTGYYTR
ncbi:MAG TPA: glycosyltransferase family 2 protein [Candidatus Saccharimonadales bacterium]|nr:glycosyltransferase family 2 protein [Candidatus Saccharimonadales bacterium]